MIGQSYFCYLWYTLLNYFLRTKAAASNNGRRHFPIYILSTLLILNHYILISMGIFEFFTPSTDFYNLFCTFLYVFDPFLIFMTTISLLYMFYKQAYKKKLSILGETEVLIEELTDED